MEEDGRLFVSVARGLCNFFERNYAGFFSLAPPPAAGWGEEDGDTPYPAKGPCRPLGTPC